MLRLAGRAGAPVVGFIESGGARMQEGIAALAGYARIFREHVALSGKIPQISVICGASAGGGSYSPALTDFVVMTERANMFLTGPAVVREVMGEDVNAAELGGPQGARAQRRRALRRADDADAALLVRDLLDHLPAHVRRARAEVAPGRPAPATTPASPCRRTSARSTTCATSSAASSTAAGCSSGRRAGRATWCAASPALDGRPVGVVANQPRYLGGVLDAESASKAARFVRTCNAFGLPLVVLVDTPGFMPGTKQEQGGVIRHGAKLVHAFAEATVPKVTVVLRKAFGGAFIAMNSRDLGADYAFAWPQAPARRDGRQAGGRGSSTGARSPPPTTRSPRATRSRPTTRGEHLSAGIGRGRGLHRRGHPAPATRAGGCRGAVDARRHRQARSRRAQHPALKTTVWSSSCSPARSC